MNRRIIFMGTPEFAVASLDALIDARMEVVAVVTAPDRPAGRGQQLRMSAVKRRAVELGLPVLQPEKLREPEFLAQLDALDASLYIVVAFRMLPETVWNRPLLGTVNLHASLLPNYRGAAPINWAIINGERHTGVSTFMIGADIDTGDILLKEEVLIEDDDDAGSLHDRMKVVGATLLVHTAKDIFDGTVSGMPQLDFIGDAVHKAPKLTRGTCRIDWSRSAQDVHDLVRGLSPEPGAWSMWTGPGKPEALFKVLRSRPVTGKHRIGEPGAVSVAGGKLLVQCGTGTLEAVLVQAQGKRPMDAAAFVRGLRKTEGIQFR
jgi:methionyl-tRNA formyltransferase